MIKRTAFFPGLRAVVLATFLLRLAGGPLLALDPGSPVDRYRVDRWNIARDNVSNTVVALAQTPDGFLWIGTTGGLARFDGLTLSSAPLLEKGEGDSLEIRALLPGRNGTLWVGSSRGLIAYSYRDGQARAFTEKDGITQDGIRRLFSDRIGHLWISFDAGFVDRYMNGKFTSFNAAFGLGGKKINAMIEDRDGHLLFSTRENGVFRYRAGEFSRFPVQGIDDTQVITMYVDSQGSLWIGAKNGLFRVTGQSAEKYTYAQGLSNNHVTSILEDSDQNLWVGTLGGLNRIQRRPDGRILFESLLKTQGIFCLFEDSEKGLWLGTYNNGIARLREGRFRSCALPAPFAGEIFSSLFEDRPGGIWIGTVSGKLWRFREEKPVDCTPTPDLFSPGISSITGDADERLWVGTNGKGVFHLRGSGFTQYTTREGLSDNQVTAILADSRGDLWFGTFAGVSLLRTQTGKIETFTSGQGLLGNRVHNIYEDRDHNIWIAADKGITVLKDGRIAGQNRQHYLKDVPVTCIYEDPVFTDAEGGVYWIATDGAGLKRLRMSDGQIVSYTQAEGMAGDSLYQFFADAQGHFWLMGKASLLRVDKGELNRRAYGDTGKIRCLSFDLTDSRDSTEFNNEFSRNSAIQTRTGELWFITRKGISILDPGKIRLNHTPPPVVIGALLFGRRPVVPSPGQNAYTFRGVKDFSARFTAPSFLSPEKVAFKYRLAGVDQDWLSLPQGRERAVTYRGLKPRHYIFTVIAGNADGEWNFTGTAVAFTLTPFFYETVGFKIAVLLLAIAALAFLVYLYQKISARRKQKEDKEIEKTPLEPAFVDDCVGRLERLMTEERVYCQEDISSQKLADMLKIKLYVLSRLLNDHIGQSFPDYINSQRIEEAKRLLSSPKGKDIKITTLAHDIGFGSMTAFHKTFKKYTGLTPNQYRNRPVRPTKNALL